MTTYRLHLTIPQVRRRVSDVPRMLSGRMPDGRGGALARGFALRLAVVAMTIIKTAYLVKAKGGTDEAGERWKPLSAFTIAERMKKGKRARESRKLKRARLAVEKAEAAYKRAKSRILKSPSLRGFLKNADRQTAAKARLWAARKKLNRAVDEYRAALGSIEILRDTGRLYNSLSPGFTGALRPDGAMEVVPGMVTFGTNVKYARRHQYGDRRCPQRRLWPEIGKWPRSWHNQINDAAASGIVKMVKLHLANAGAGP